MQPETNRDIVLSFYQAFDDRNLEFALSLLMPNFIAHLAGMPEPLSRTEFEEFGRSFYTAFSQGQHHFEQVIVAGDRIITCGTFTAQHLGEFQSLPPTGQTIRLSIMHIDRVENGKIVEHWGQGDALGLMQQLGIVFLPGPKLWAYLLKQLTRKLFKS
ncbi:MAG: ester cyclase [Spirulina sp. SIO3F2]|nr:ester cyclase [Spirulina sp. SIO3F2]